MKAVPLLLTLLLSLAAGSAAAQTAPPPDAPGSHAVGQTVFEIVDDARADRPLEIQAWYPIADAHIGTPAFYGLGFGLLGLTSNLATGGAPPVRSGGPYPLIVFSHGSGGLNIQSVQLCEVLASHGFVVVAPNHTGNTATGGGAFTTSDRPLDVSFLIDTMFARHAAPGDLFEGAVRTADVGVAGHSFGGFTALAMVSGWQFVPPDPRVSAVMGIAPASSGLTDAELASIDAPLMLLSGTLDTSTPIVPNTTRPYQLVASNQRYRADITGASHTHFANICDLADALLSVGIQYPDGWIAIGAAALIQPYIDTCLPPAFDLATAQRIQDLYAVAFFQLTLGSDPRYAVYLTAAYAAEHLPDVSFFPSAPARPACGLGFEIALALGAIGIARRRAARRTRRR